MTFDPQALLFAVLATMAVFGGRWVWHYRRDKRRTAQAKAEFSAWQAAQPPIVEPSKEQMDEFARCLPDLALPGVILEPDLAAEVTAGGTRIGGPVWLPDGAEWPTGKGGRQLEFLAQIDFAGLPPLADYPEEGLLQLFVGRDDLHGADFDAPDEGDFSLQWHPRGAVGGRSVPPPRLLAYGDLGDDGYNNSPFIDDRIRENGLMLRGRVTMMDPMAFTWPVDALIADLGIDPRSAAVDKALEGHWNAHQPAHHFVGGHPVFVQHDYRLDIAYPPEKLGQPSPWRDYDRLLIQLTSANGLQWGDVGEANVMIRRADLIARNFSRAIFWWDCS